MDNAPRRLREAAKQRRDLMKILRACTCTWPLDVLRNGSGHANDCLAHVVSNVIKQTDEWLTERRPTDG